MIFTEGLSASSQFLHILHQIKMYPQWQMLAIYSKLTEKTFLSSSMEEHTVLPISHALKPSFSFKHILKSMLTSYVSLGNIQTTELSNK